MNQQYRATSFEVCVCTHVALRMLLALSQPVSCIFWPIRMMNRLVATNKLHKHKGICCTPEWPAVHLLYVRASELRFSYNYGKSIYKDKYPTIHLQLVFQQKQSHDVCLRNKFQTNLYF